MVRTLIKPIGPVIIEPKTKIATWTPIANVTATAASSVMAKQLKYLKNTLLEILPSCAALLNEFVADKFPDGQPVDLVVGGVLESDALKTIVSDGLMLVGDAAHHTEPLSGAGILPAIISGKTAGEVARKAVRQNDASASTLTRVRG